jgi:FKBP-type peptidyl-prolyl cis-trans isomerase
MKEGTWLKLFVPADLAFGEKVPLADQAFIFKGELLKILEPSVN